MLGRLWAALGLAGVYSGCVMIGEPPLLVSGLASNYFRIRLFAPYAYPTLKTQPPDT